ncbi:MAG: DUF6364 family protein [Gemmatimonadota bacterium]|nr:DUF6364 family protein [Gemmatimonadota bacterium]
MAKKRLNITVEPEIFERARRYSDLHGTSISRLVGEFLARLPEVEDAEPRELPPTVRRLLGVAKGGPDREDYRRHLIEKHGA